MTSGSEAALSLTAEAVWKVADLVVRGGSGNLDRCDEWSFCLTAARLAAKQEKP
jgi:hypothetical protein